MNLVLDLAKLNGFVFFLGMQGHAILDECQLKAWTLPVTLQESVQREIDVLRLAFVEQQCQSRKLFKVQPILQDMRW